MRSDSEQRVIASPALWLLLLVAAGLRVLSAQGELWLDEVWSLVMVRQLVKTPLDVFTQLRIDNNHFLNSLWIFELPADGPDVAYRMLSVVCGVLSVVVAGLLSRRRGKWVSLCAMGTLAVSFITVNYSSEARGYGPLMLFVMLACWGWSEGKRTPGWKWDLVFAASCILGFLAHVAFLQLFVPFVVLSVGRMGREKSRGERARVLMLRVILPGLFFVALWWINLRKMGIGGGNTTAYLEVILQTLSLGVGGMTDQNGVLVSALIGIVLAGCVAWHFFRVNVEWGWLFLGTTFLMPAVLLILMGREDIYPRYFLIGIVLFQWGLGDWIGTMLERGANPTVRICAIGLMTFFIAGNGLHDARLIRDQRGHYLAMLTWLEENAKEGRVVVGTDHPFRQGMMLSYYVPRSGLRERLQMPQPQEEAEWILLHAGSHEPVAMRTINEGRYELQRVFPGGELSGWELRLYRRRGQE